MGARKEGRGGSGSGVTVNLLIRGGGVQHNRILNKVLGSSVKYDVTYSR
jgi:hypothetical protein